MQGWLGWLHDSSLGEAMRNEVWLYPVIEVVHIVGFAVLVGAVTLFDLRLLGYSRTLPVSALADHLLRWAMAALLLIVPAGLMMFAAQPEDFANNPVFILKLCLIATAGANAALFHLGVYRSVAGWDVNAPAPGTARFQALLSMLLWIAVILCGRLLAYT
jgi:hypothetical protein